jgi:hypothetical protein
MAKKPAQVVQTAKVDPKRERTIKNRKERLERHLKKFPSDQVAQAALGKEKPARKTPKTKGAFPKPVIRIIECLQRPTGKRDKKTGQPITLNASGFVSEKFKEGTVLTFGSREPILVETVGKNGRPGLALNPLAVEAWTEYQANSRKASQRKPRGKK